MGYYQVRVSKLKKKRLPRVPDTQESWVGNLYKLFENIILKRGVSLEVGIWQLVMAKMKLIQLKLEFKNRFLDRQQRMNMKLEFPWNHKNWKVSRMRYFFGSRYFIKSEHDNKIPWNLEYDIGISLKTWIWNRTPRSKMWKLRIRERPLSIVF